MFNQKLTGGQLNLPHIAKTEKNMKELNDHTVLVNGRSQKVAEII